MLFPSTVRLTGRRAGNLGCYGPSRPSQRPDHDPRPHSAQIGGRMEHSRHCGGFGCVSGDRDVRAAALRARRTGSGLARYSPAEPREPCSSSLQTAHLIAVACSPAPGGHESAVRCVCLRTKPLNWALWRRSLWIRSTACSNEQARALVPETFQGYRDILLIGSPETIRRRIAEYEAVGVQELVISFPDAALDFTRRFAKEFIT
jgi:alkanesulfonate monooxygenase SsuD/methylene tetrahydromethanopterin reductase-like flavin-dependent oxidoreductase (luciferase family)